MLKNAGHRLPKIRLARRLVWVALALLLAMLTAVSLNPGATSPVGADPDCQIDTAGANDEPGQKDLTQMCVDYAGLPDSIDMSWNWDETGWPGGNTGDACSLYDTDGDGLVNYALCVTVGGKPATEQDTRLYSCGDDKPGNSRASRIHHQHESL